LIYIDADDLTNAPDNAPVLVRIDPAVGYVKGNTHIVSAKAARWLDGKSVAERQLALSGTKPPHLS
jgi:hypothetical protein